MLNLNKVLHSLFVSTFLLAASPAIGQTPQAEPPVGPSTALQRRAAPPARILEFRAQPESVKAGEPVTLIWATENPDSISITPDLGRVASRGSRRVSPAASTTYTLTVTGPNGTETRTVRINIAGTNAAAVATSNSATAKKEIPRTADGKPDLTGVYSNAPRGATIQAPPPMSTLPRTPTLKPGAEKFRVVREGQDTGQYAACNPPGVPQTFAVPYFFQIIQSPRYVVILYEYLHLYRVIPTDGTPHPVDPDPFWMGHSIGHWEGDTLVVDSIGFNDKTEINGYRHTEDLHVVERFKRVDYDTLQYEAVVEDPNVFQSPWVVARNFLFRPEFDRVDEFFCENNRDYRVLFDKK
jgi:hypothetical protein